MRLRFHTPGHGTAESIEPGPFFRLIGGMLCRGAANEPVATWLERWRLSDAQFACAESLDPVVIYFESNAGLASSAFGPFEAFRVCGGAAEGAAAAAGAQAAPAGTARPGGVAEATGTAGTGGLAPADGAHPDDGRSAAPRGLAAYTGARLLARLDERSLLWYPPRAHDGWASLLIAPPGKSRFDLLREQASQARGA